ncbi:hypothetical protein GbCGDNIH6_8294 [Granulibacter bethesdensis]|nr:hypothetical protein GbCGDNIH6_8294 [Granulibacter bethesdensis]
MAFISELIRRSGVKISQSTSIYGVVFAIMAHRRVSVRIVT